MVTKYYKLRTTLCSVLGLFIIGIWKQKKVSYYFRYMWSPVVQTELTWCPHHWLCQMLVDKGFWRTGSGRMIKRLCQFSWQLQTVLMQSIPKAASLYHFHFQGKIKSRILLNCYMLQQLIWPNSSFFWWLTTIYLFQCMR